MKEAAPWCLRARAGMSLPSVMLLEARQPQPQLPVSRFMGKVKCGSSVLQVHHAPKLLRGQLGPRE